LGLFVTGIGRVLFLWLFLLGVWGVTLIRMGCSHVGGLLLLVSRMSHYLLSAARYLEWSSYSLGFAFQIRLSGIAVNCLVSVIARVRYVVMRFAADGVGCTSHKMGCGV
jgi:hypothetical protein